MKMNWRDILGFIYNYTHTERFVAPWGAGPVALTSGVGAYTYGAASADIIAAGAQAVDFHISWVTLSGCNTNADYEISLVYGAGDTECAEISFTRNSGQDRSVDIMVSTVPIPAGSRIRAFLRTSTGAGTENISIKVGYHKHVM